MMAMAPPMPPMPLGNMGWRCPGSALGSEKRIKINSTARLPQERVSTATIATATAFKIASGT